jgi:hypothetical protein
MGEFTRLGKNAHGPASVGGPFFDSFESAVNNRFSPPVWPIAGSGGLWFVRYAFSVFGKTRSPTVCQSGVTT